MYKFLISKLIFPVAELVRKTSIIKNETFLEQSQYWDCKKINNYQSKKLRELIKHAYENVPYYKKIFDSLNIKPEDIKCKKDLIKLPLLTKDIIRKNKDELKAKNYLNNSFVTYTSGSTGKPMKFYHSNEDIGWIWAAEFRTWKRAGYTLGDKYVKFSLNPREKLSKKIQDYIMNCYYIYALNLQRQEIEKEIINISRYKPKFLYGYSSTISIISKIVIVKSIRMDVKAVFTFGDNLTVKNRKLIEKAFNCKVYDSYGCGGEGLNIASQCNYGRYHINEELVIVESYDNEAIITSLNNYAMPLIRYTPNDFITLGKSCNCGIKLKVIKNVDGRSKDVVICPNGNMLVVHFFTVFFEHKKNISEFKVIQKSKKEIIIYLVTELDYDRKSEESNIKKYIEKASGKELRIVFRYLRNIPLEKNGKRKIIENKLK